MSGKVEGRGLPPGVMVDGSAKARVALEVEAGLRCIGCGERISTGFEFTVGRALMRVGDLGGPRQYETGTFYTCPGSERCTAMLDILNGKDALAVRVIEPNEILYTDEERVRALIHKIAAAAGGGERNAGPTVPPSALERDDQGLPILGKPQEAPDA